MKRQIKLFPAGPPRQIWRRLGFLLSALWLVTISVLVWLVYSQLNLYTPLVATASSLLTFALIVRALICLHLAKS